MLLTIFLAIVFCAAITLMLISAVVLIKDKKLFSSAPKEALELVIDRKQEEFYGARKIGWTDFHTGSYTGIYKQKVRIQYQKSAA